MSKINFLNRVKNYKCFSIILLGFIYSCVEPYNFKSETYEKLLVVDATLTNEFKNQIVNLSKVYKIDNDTIIPESEANITVIDNEFNIYEFTETSPGNYKSVNKFAILPGKKYHLEIETSNGRLYASNEETLPDNPAEMENLYAKRMVNNEGVEGIAILTNTTNEDNAEIGYYKFEYVETYKIISPFVSNYDLILNNSGALQIVPKSKEEEICYGTRESNEIQIASTGALSENILSDYLIKFYKINDLPIRHRYSILVRQINISQEAYDYYQALKELSNSDNVFSQNQPGFINGNITSLEDPNEKVIGHLNLGKISSERIFFDFTDFFDLVDKPNSAVDCKITRPERIMDVIAFIGNNQKKLFGDARDLPPSAEGEGPYRLVDRECIDCTVLGNNTKPEFWVD